jgi:hypothetical protein
MDVARNPGASLRKSRAAARRGDCLNAQYYLGAAQSGYQHYVKPTASTRRSLRAAGAALDKCFAGARRKRRKRQGR